MKSLVQYLFVIAISVGLLAPVAEACDTKPHKASHRVGLLQKKGARKPAAHSKKPSKKSGKKISKKKSGKNQGHKKHKASAGEMRARQYLTSSGK